MYSYVQDLPFTEDVFRRFRAAVPDDTPPGLIARIAFQMEDGVRLMEVWKSEEDRSRFITESVQPVVTDEGFFADTGFQPPDREPPRDELKLLDVWTTGEYRLDL